MELLTGWLVSVAAADLVRGSHDEVTERRSQVAGFVGAAVATATAWIYGVEGCALAGTFAGALALLAVWIRASSQALHKVTWTYPAVVALAGPALVAVGLSGQADARPQPWFEDWFEGLAVPALAKVSVEQFVMGLAVALFLINTCNVLVRIVLRGANAPAAKAERRLKGGRLLGPMERIFIFALALSGNFAAASVVAGAKSLLRFPEIKSAEEADRVDSVTEYFLIGSFTSWLSALVFVPVVLTGLQVPTILGPCRTSPSSLPGCRRPDPSPRSSGSATSASPTARPSWRPTPVRSTATAAASSTAGS